MDAKDMMKPANLERYAFLWSEVRLVVGAVALFLGGIPPIFYLFSLGGFAAVSLVATGLNIAWIVSGLASVYLLYRWYAGGMKLFGKKDPKDMAAFLVSAISGINLGITGIAGFNIGMGIMSNYPAFVVTGIVYLVSAGYLYQRWTKNGKKLF